MSYVRQILTPGERVMYTAKLSPVMFALPLATFVPAAVMLAMTLAVKRFHHIVPFGGIALAISGVLLLAAWVRRSTTEIAVTQNRLIFKRGAMRIDADELWLERIQSVQIVQSLADRMLGRGDVVVHESGVGQIRIEGIGAPIAFRKALAADKSIATVTTTN